MTIDKHSIKFKKPSNILIIIIISAFIVRIFGIWKGIWLDEATSVFYANSTFSELIQKLSMGNAPPFYYLILKGWIFIFGTSELALRLPSLISTIGGLVVIYCFLKKINNTTGTLGVVLIAFSPLSIYYSQEARNYGLFFLILSLYIYCYQGFFKGIQKKRYLAGLVSCSFFLCLTHNIGFFFIIGMQISLFLIKSKELRLLWLKGQLGLFIFLCPWLFILLKQVSRLFTLSWFVPIWESKSIFTNIFETYLVFCAGPYPPYMGINTFSVEIATIISILLFIIAIFGYINHKDDIVLNGLLFGAILTILLLITFSVIKHPIYIPGRSDLFLYPIYVTFLALGIDTFKLKHMSSCIMVVILTTYLLVLVPYYTNDSKSFSKSYANKIVHCINKGDLLITTHLTYLVSKYYLDRSGINVKIVSYPESTEKHPGYFFEKEHTKNISKIVDYSHELLITIKASIKMKKKAYLIFTPHKINHILLKVLSKELICKRIHVSKFYQSLIGTPIIILALEEKKQL